MVSSLIEIAIGWFITYKVSDIVGAKGTLATVIKIIGVLFLIGGFVSLARTLINF